MSKFMLTAALVLSSWTGTAVIPVGSALADGLPDETIVKVYNDSGRVIYVRGYIGDTQVLTTGYISQRNNSSWYLKVKATDQPMRNVTSPIYIRVFSADDNREIANGYCYFRGAGQPQYEYHFPGGGGR